MKRQKDIIPETEPPRSEGVQYATGEVVQLLSHVRLFATPWTVARQASLSFTIFQSFLKLTSTELVMPSNHLNFCCLLLLLPSISPSIKVFPNELVLCIRWPKYWSCSFSISPSSEYAGMISFRMDWLNLLAGQGTFKSLFQHHSSKASILWCSAVFIVQLSCPYMTTGKTIAFTRWTFVGKVMSLLSNMLSTLVIAFLLRSKHGIVLSNKKKWPRNNMDEPHLKIIMLSERRQAQVSTYSVNSFI